jgi:hypothetical protein
MMFALVSAGSTRFVSSRVDADVIARARAAFDGEITDIYQIHADNHRAAREAFNNELGVWVAKTTPQMTMSL